MRVLVTGGAGFVGSHIVDALIARKHTVYVLDNFSSGSDRNLEHSEAQVYRGDISTLKEMQTLFDYAPDAICHQAAQPSLLRSIQEPIADAMINIIGTLNVIQAARKCGAHVVMASTSAVYDVAGEQPYREDAPILPNRPYGVAKASAEMYLRASGLSYTILRYGNVYGPRQVPVGENQLVPHALNHIYKRSPFKVNGDGNQTRDFVYVGDVARANVQALEERWQGTYNISLGVLHSVNEVLKHLSAYCDWAGEWKHGPDKPSEPRSVMLNTSKAMVTHGYFASTPLVVGLAQTARWYKENTK
jgi:UDP-glucose 4-epimerase